MVFENFAVDYEDVIEFASRRIICDAIFLHKLQTHWYRNTSIDPRRSLSRDHFYPPPHRSMLRGISRDIKYLLWSLMWNMKNLYTYILPLLPYLIPSFHQVMVPNFLISTSVTTRQNWCMSCGAFWLINNRQVKRATLSIPKRSPNVVITYPDDAWLHWGNGKKYCHRGIAVTSKTELFTLLKSKSNTTKKQLPLYYFQLTKGL